MASLSMSGRRAAECGRRAKSLLMTKTREGDAVSRVRVDFLSITKIHALRQDGLQQQLAAHQRHTH